MERQRDSILYRIGKALQLRNEDITHEHLPERWVDLIRYLDEHERQRGGRQSKRQSNRSGPKASN